MRNKMFFLSLVFILSIILIACQTNDTPSFNLGTGTSEDPFIIETFDDLYKLSSTTKYYYELKNDIVNTFDKTIDSSVGDFYGVIDGNNYMIYGLKIINLHRYSDKENDDLYVGLFGMMKSGSYIHDLRLVNEVVSVDYDQFGYIGSLAGYMEEDSKIEDISVNGVMEVNIKDGTIGGVIGTGEYLKNVYTDIDMTIISRGNALSIGGIVGYNNEYLGYGNAYGKIRIEDGLYPEFGNDYYSIGGVVGIADGEVKNCQNSTDIIFELDELNDSMNSHIGGIVGGLYGDLAYSMSDGNITAISNGVVMAGGLSGFIYDDGLVHNSLALSVIVFIGGHENDEHIGGVVGFTSDIASAYELYYSQEVGVLKAIGNHENSELVSIEDHTQNYYLNGIGLDYLNGQFIFEEGKLPRIIPDLKLG